VRGCKWCNIATVISPSVPHPYTIAGSPSRGGWRSTPCSCTENGSASTACSSLNASGTGMHCETCAAKYGANTPFAAAQLPMWMAGGSRPSVKCSQSW